MTKTFEIKETIFAVVPCIDDDDCYRLVVLQTPDSNPYGYDAIHVLDCPACEDFYGDIDTVAEVMKEYISEEAEKPYPWWTLLGALFEWGGDAERIENEERARDISDVIANATTLGTVDMDDEEAVNSAKARLKMEDNDVTAIHTFVNGSAGSFSLAEEWD